MIEKYLFLYYALKKTEIGAMSLVGSFNLINPYTM